MKKKLVSILIANVLFLSNVGFTSFAVEQNMEAASLASSAETEESEETEAEEEKDQESEESGSYYNEDDIQYVKIAEFAELPEEVTHQKIGLGGNIEELVFPETLEIHVVADNDREERISRNLGNERQERELAEQEAADAASSASSEEDDASAEGSSGDDVVFFESDTDEAVDAATTGGESEEIYEESSSQEVASDNSGELSTITKPGNAATESSAAEASKAPEAAANTEKSEAGPAPTPGNDAIEDPAQTAPAESAPAEIAPSEDAGQAGGESDAGSTDAGTEGSSDNLIGMIKAAFKAMVVHAAESEPKETGDEAKAESKDEEAADEAGAESGSDEAKEETPSEASAEASKDTETETATDASSGASSAAEDSADSEYHYEYTEDEISVEMVSGIHWILDAERNDTQEFVAKEVGKEFVFVPILLIPDYYYIEAELPTITVEIVEEFFPFDQTVTVDDVKIRVRADKGVFPDGATLNATRIVEDNEQKVQDAIAEQEEAESEEVKDVVKSYTFDIQVLDESGEEVEPNNEKGRVLVSFETAETGDEKLSAEIYHIIEAEATENPGEDNSAKTADGSEENSENAEAAEGNAENGEEAVETVIVAVEKLESLIVDGEEGKAVEAETTSFSKYSLVLLTDDKPIVSVDKGYINIDETLKAKIGLRTISSVTFDVKEADNYLYAAQLEKGTTVSAMAGTAPEATDYGLYKKTGATLAWYIVARRPFLEKAFTAKIKFTDETSMSIKLEDDSKSGDKILNYKYPTAKKDALSDKDFVLEMPISDTGDVDAFYQWQVMKNSDDAAWEDIPLANTSKYGTSGDDFVSGYWYRCVVDGKESNPVQVITPSGDTTRKWLHTFGKNQCYISNGALAYTVIVEKTASTTSPSAPTSKLRFEVVGQHTFENDPYVYMIQSTRGGNGWRMFSNSSTDSIDYNDYNADFTSLWFSFDENDIKKLHVTAVPQHNAMAIGADCNLGDLENFTTYAVLDSGSKSTLSNLSEVWVVGTGTEEEAQRAVNDGKGDYIPSFIYSPQTTPSAYWIANTPSQYAYPISSVVQNTGFIEGDSPAILTSWTNVTGPVNFDFELAGVTTNKILEAVAKTGNSQSYSLNSVIKTLQLKNDNSLNSYAKKESLGGASIPVEVQLRFASGTSSGKSSIGNILPKYQKTSSTSSTTSSTSSSSSSYMADYFDVNVKAISKTSKNSTSTVTTTITELDDVVEIVASYDFENKEDIRVYRYHDSSPSEFANNSSGADGTFRVDTSDGKIHIFTRKFSTYAIAYKPITYYTVTFDTGTSTSQVKIKAGDKVGRPSDPTKEGYTFKGWYVNGSSTNLYNFDNEVWANTKLVAGWTEIKETKDKTATDNESRAPKTKDTMPIVWLWVLLLVAGITTFGCSIKELMNDGKGIQRKEGFIDRLFKVLWRLEIVIATTIRFFIKKLKNNKQKVRITVSGVVIVISAIILANTILQYRQGEQIYAEVEETYIEETPEIITDVVENTETAEDVVIEGFNWWDCANVSLAELKEQYPDVVGWIYFENEDISYPVMYSGDNSKYLRTTYSGEQAKAGSIFIDGESTPDFSDPHSIIYGHNMRDLSMFGRLRYYKTNPDYYEDHQYFQIFTENCVYRYQIFAYEEVADNDDVFWVYGKEPEGYYKMLKTVEKNSYHKTGITTNESDHVITLATCTSKDNQRLIVSAVRVGEYSYNQ